MENLDEKLKEVDLFIYSSMQEQKLPAISLTIEKNDEILYSKGHGYRDLDKLLPATENTLYMAGSITKSFTALAVLQLYQNKKLELYAPVKTYLPSLNFDGKAGKIQVNHLLFHSSGFPTLNVAEVLIMKMIGKDSSYISINSFDEFIDTLNLAIKEKVASPGKRYFYWNEGYMILGKIIEKISGLKYEDYIKENILLPLKMKKSAFYAKSAVEDGDFAVPYYFDDKGERKPVPIPDNPLNYAAGGLITSTVELARYLKFWLGLDSSSILSEELLKEALKPRISTARISPYGKEFYGYGWFINDGFFGKTMISHSGNVGVFSAFAAFVPEEKISVAVASNSGKALASQIGIFSLASIIGFKTDDLPFIKERKIRDAFKGIYRDYRSYTVVKIYDGTDGLLNMEYSSDEMHMILPVIVSGEKAYTFMNYYKYPLEYKLDSKENTVKKLCFERHCFNKVNF